MNLDVANGCIMKDALLFREFKRKISGLNLDVVDAGPKKDGLQSWSVV